MKRLVALAGFIFVGLCLEVLNPVAAPRDNSSDALARRCTDFKLATERIKQCRLLVDSNLLEDSLKAVPHFFIAHAYAEINDLDRAIEHAQKYLIGMQQYHQKNPSALRCKDMKGAWLKLCLQIPGPQISAAYKLVGDIEEIQMLDLKTSRNKEAVVTFAKRAVANYSAAIVANPDNHKAYAKRGEILARFCKGDEAEADFRLAISSALRRNSKADAEEYRDKLSFGTASCWEDYRGRL